MANQLYSKGQIKYFMQYDFRKKNNSSPEAIIDSTEYTRIREQLDKNCEKTPLSVTSKTFLTRLTTSFSGTDNFTYQ